MSIAVAFLSGKGGSGKTTLALSIADLLCRCQVKTLLVDCDLSTNGATYFYEAQMANTNNDKQLDFTSFSNILNMQKQAESPIPLKIASSLDFIPSVSEISSQHIETLKDYSSDSAHPLPHFLDWAKLNYDVILFDCQAGYTKHLPVLLPLMDVDLFVMEADSISASAMRSLHLKIGGNFGHAKIYQVFNKATPEEYDIYSKIVGTFFVNIGTLLFDWKIRQAFSRSQIPDLKNTSAKFGSDLCDICTIMFPDKSLVEKIVPFSSQLRYQQLKETRKEVEESHLKMAGKPHTSLNYFLLGLIVATFPIIMSILYKYISGYTWAQSVALDDPSQLMLMLMFAIACLLIVLIPMTSTIYSFREIRKERQQYKRELEELDKEIEKISILCHKE